VSTTKQHRDSATNERNACRFESCVSRHVDGELDAGHAMDVENHLAECEPCDESAKLLRAMKASLRRRGTERAPDELRARLSLALARESTAAAPSSFEDRSSLEGLTPAPGAVAASSSSSVFSSASSPARDSLLGGAHDRAQRQAARSSRMDGGRGARVAYGVGAFAVAAGVALAVAGERYGESVHGSSGDESASSNTTSDQTEAAGMGESTTRSASRDASKSRRGAGSRESEYVSGTQQPRSYGEGPRAVGLDGAAAPGTGLVPIENAPTSTPSSASVLVGNPMSGRVTFDTLLDDLVALHANPLPPDTTNPDEMRKYDALVGVKVRRPTLRPYAASFRGARLHAMRDAQRTAMLQYTLGDGHHVTVYVFNPREMQLGTTHMQPRVVKDEPIYVGSVRGFSVAAAERRGVGYALATDRDTDDCVKMVASSLP